MGLTRLAGFGAFGFVVIILGLNAVLESTKPPAGDAQTADVARYFAEHTDLVRTGVALAAVAWVFISVFAAGVLAHQRDAWAAVGMIGIAMQNVLFAGVSAARLALTAGGDPATLWQLHNALWVTNSVGLVLTLTGFSLGGLRSATLRPWHAGLGLTSAALLLVAAIAGVYTVDGGGPGGLSVVGLIGWLLWAAWLAIFGVVLVRAKQSAGTAMMPNLSRAAVTR